MTDPNLWNQLLIWPILNLLVAFYNLAEWLRLPGPLGFAIIFLTVVIRLILYPLMHAQLKSAKKMTNLKPHMDALNAKHKNDKTALQQAQLALYKEHGVNPAAGCLPLLIQFPVLIALYNVFYQVLNTSDAAAVLESINAVVYSGALKLTTLDVGFFGINLGSKPSEWQVAGWWLLSIPIITALLQWVQTKLMLPPKTKKAEVVVAKSGKHAKKAEDVKPDMASEMQQQMAIISPLMFGFFAFQFPVGLALYWNVFSLFGIMQQLQINKAHAPEAAA